MDAPDRVSRTFSDTFLQVTQSSLDALRSQYSISQLSQISHQHRHRRLYLLKISIYIIAVIEIIELLIVLLATTIFYNKNYSYSIYTLQSFVSGLVAFLVGGLSIGGLILGVYKEKYLLIIPHMACQLVAMVGTLVTIVLYAVAANVYKDRWKMEIGYGHAEHARKAKSTYTYTVTVIVLCSIGLIAQIGFYYQVSKCYKDLKLKQTRTLHVVRRQTSV